MAATPDGKLSWFGCKSLIVTGFIQYIVVKLIMVVNKNLEIAIWSPMEVKPTVVNDNRIVPNILEDMRLKWECSLYWWSVRLHTQWSRLKPCQNHLKPSKHKHVPHCPEKSLPDAVLRVVFAISVTTEPDKLRVELKCLIHLWNCTELTSPSSSSPLVGFAQVHFQAQAPQRSPSLGEPPGESSWWIVKVFWNCNTIIFVFVSPSKSLAWQITLPLRCTCPLGPSWCSGQWLEEL